MATFCSFPMRELTSMITPIETTVSPLVGSFAQSNLRAKEKIKQKSQNLASAFGEVEGKCILAAVSSAGILNEFVWKICV